MTPVLDPPNPLLSYPFSAEDFVRANNAWGANCGPAALAFALHTHIDAVRSAIPDFERRRYTSPTMMKHALTTLGVPFNALETRRPIASVTTR